MNLFGSEEWCAKYRRRAGIESLNRGLDRRTGIKHLRVRGMKAVKHSVYAKVTGWNIIQSARAIWKAAKAERKRAKADVGAWSQPIVREYREVTRHLLRSLADVKQSIRRLCGWLAPASLTAAA